MITTLSITEGTLAIVVAFDFSCMATIEGGIKPRNINVLVLIRKKLKNLTKVSDFLFLFFFF